MNPGGPFQGILIAAFNNIASSPLDQNRGATSGGAWTTIQPGSVTPGQAYLTLSVAFLSDYDNTARTITINGAYTITDVLDPVNGVNVGGAVAYKVLSSATAPNPTWTAGASMSTASAEIATFKY